MYDYIIVGAGSAGCVLANRLSATPSISVLLLEAGEPDNKTEMKVPAAFSKLFHTDHDWDYTTVPQEGLNDRQLYVPRGRTLGGSSSINAMIYIRGNPADYDGWAAELGAPHWRYDQVLPYFRRSEDQSRGEDAFHGVGGPLHVEDLRDPRPLTGAFIDAAGACGIPQNLDFNGTQQVGAGAYQVTMRRGARDSAATAYLKPVLKRENLHVQTDAHVERLAHNGERFHAVDYRQGDTIVSAEARREIILCGGAINTPQLLMLSGIGPGAHLQEYGIDVLVDLPGVGQNLQDHLACGVIITSQHTTSLANAENIGNIAKYLIGRVGPLTSNVAEAGAYVRSPHANVTPDIQFHFAPNYFVNHGADNPPGDGFSLGSVLVDPHSRGTIRLADPNPYHPPLIDPQYLSDAHGHDMDVLLHGVKLAREIIDAPPLRRYVASEYLPGAGFTSDADLREHIRNTSETLYHPVGTCKMGRDDDPLAVLDPAMRLRGAAGVRVVDASVMPSVPNGNTNAPTIMIAEVAADLILSDD